MRRERTRDTLADLALWVLLCCPVLLRAGADGGGPVATGTGIVLLGVAVLVGRRLPLPALGIVVALSALEHPQLISPEYAPALPVFGALAGRRSPRARPALLTFAGLAAAGPALLFATGGELWSWPGQLAAVFFAVVVPWLVGRYARQYAELVRTGWELADRMEREQRAVADRERIRERSRIAGDMHDSLGHDLSLLAVRAAALEVDRALGEEQRAAAGELRKAAADATARLRDIVGVLRADDEPAPTVPAGETVRALVERARDAGVDVTLHENHEDHEEATATAASAETTAAVPEMTDRAVHRVVQEAVTNAARHAPGAAVAVSVVREPDAVRVTVENGPPARPPGPPGGGTGLVGLGERVRLAGGSIGHGPCPGGGFTVTARLPTATTGHGAGATPEAGAGAGTKAGTEAGPEAAAPVTTTSARELDRARRRVRRGLWQALAAPAVALVVLGVVFFFVDQHIRARSLLERERYDLIRVGDTHEDARTRLPEHPLESRPAGVDPEPAGAGRCAYYRVHQYSDDSAYRLCFKDGRLASKAVVSDVDNEEDRP
ncbi:sensor histidine kinase [Streptomyces yaizuensis]|uniref:histidine kinase n=1 Tax=Streptomyces yaizuensis TaxID=2989713 RepID=A0ABQ5NWJ2_9ACTN|nr:histidine kinase [Streptomyces sp. YSPA8]GLF94754.1 histidine kinase [Streptomyces sp. YSPA8]